MGTRRTRGEPTQRRRTARSGMAANESLLRERHRLGLSLSGVVSQTGRQYGGTRDLYEALGYTRVPIILEYWETYKRQDIAGRIVDLPAEDTWRKAPTVGDAGKRTSPFVKAWDALIKDRGVWHHLERVDRLAGIGRFAVLLIGARDGKRLDEPLTKGCLKGPEDVLFLSPYMEGSVQVTMWGSDPTSERFNLPEFYTVRLGGEGTTGQGSQRVHWTRVLHVAEDLLEDDVYGTPRLEGVLNRLYDLEKVAGGSAEATWRTMDRGIVAAAREGFRMDPADRTAMQEEIENYLHGLQRYIRAQGMDISTLGSEELDPTGVFDVLIALISARTGIPKRILLGSERGELASSQDENNWAKTVASRQTKFAEPLILRAFIDRLIWLGALPRPTKGEYQVTWAPLFELNPVEKSQAMLNYSKAGSDVAGAALVSGHTEEEAKLLAKRPEPPPVPPTGEIPQSTPDEAEETDEAPE